MFPLLALFSTVAIWVPTGAYFADWTQFGGRPNEPVCVDIPQNMSLCSDIGYKKMRLPNLLDHDTLKEVQQQSGSWVPLLNVRCHPHTQLFLCSLFTPVCLESQIFPCRSLCESVKKKCESRMKNYGYHWPDMLRCDKFPKDNDMCIKPPGKQEFGKSFRKGRSEPLKDESCGICSHDTSPKTIIDRFCESEVVIRVKVKKQDNTSVNLTKALFIKGSHQTVKKFKKIQLRVAKTESLLRDQEQDCCTLTPGKQPYLMMGTIQPEGGSFIPSFIFPFDKSKRSRNTIRNLSKTDCSKRNEKTNDEEERANRAEKKLKKKRRKDKFKKGNKNSTAEGKVRRKNKKKKSKQEESTDAPVDLSHNSSIE